VEDAPLGITSEPSGAITCAHTRCSRQSPQRIESGKSPCSSMPASVRILILRTLSHPEDTVTPPRSVRTFCCDQPATAGPLGVSSPLLSKPQPKNIKKNQPGGRAGEEKREIRQGGPAVALLVAEQNVWTTAGDTDILRMRYVRRIKILTEAGIEEHGDFHFDLWGDWRLQRVMARTIAPDGSEVDAKGASSTKSPTRGS